MNHPIGIFDSGVGGLSVLKELAQLLPHENICYLGDDAHCPYGSRNSEEIQQLSFNITDFLLKKNCKLIVVACNTATSAAIETLRNAFPTTSFVGMEPAIKPAALQTKTRNIGILATASTLQGRLFNEAKTRYAHNINIHIAIGEGLVELVENGESDSPQAYNLLNKYLQPMLMAQIDELVLGCTHYPFLEETIHKITGGKVRLLNPAPAVALQVQRVLISKQLINPSALLAKYHFYSTRSIFPLRHTQKKHLKEISSRCFFHEQKAL
ncbi:MAG: glutamate racemase [Bacteroidales bacterium]